MAEDEEEWRFAVEDVGSAETAEDPAEEGQNEDRSDAEDLPGVPEGPEKRPPLEPGSPSLENTLFVLLGVFLTLFMIVRVMTLLGG
ncbi:hypothetical protein BRC86_06670 [Halobacteriales archaeon QS_3_64_16]|nr:MAG: hypothetical protein BRC86_06670 [Halobacteriales archaeon QS_3_64_16]